MASSPHHSRIWSSYRRKMAVSQGHIICLLVVMVMVVVKMVVMVVVVVMVVILGETISTEIRSQHPHQVHY